MNDPTPADTAARNDGGPTPRRILVTGGAGYVGASLVPALLDDGHHVTVLDWFVFQPPHEDPSGRLHPIVGDLRDDDCVARALEGIDTVIHLAAISNDPSSALDPEATRAINLDATLRFADRAVRAGVRRFVNTSSASVYGLSEEERVTEDLLLEPLTIYASCKAESEAYILGLNSPTFTATSLRPATLSGYTPRLRLDLTVNILTFHAVCKGTIRVFGGEQYRPNLSVEDVVRSYRYFLDFDAAKVGGRSFNLCEGNYQVIEIAHRIREVLGSDRLTIERTQTDDLRSYRLCADRARDELGFVPSHGIEHSIRAVATALEDGRVPDPEATIYRNVEWLRGRDLRTPGAFLHPVEAGK